MFAAFRPALWLFVLLTGITGVAYPVFVTLLSQTLFHAQAEGSLIRTGAGVVGSELLGQSFASPRYFWGRPSATSRVPYDAAASSGSNLGPLNPALAGRMHASIASLRAAAADSSQLIPVDLITASGSGLDPHISPAAAEYQVERVARERGLSPARVRSLVAAHTQARQFGLLGEPRVNVLALDLALDHEAGSR